MKNNEVANRCNKNFWSDSGIETENKKVLTTSRNRSHHLTLEEEAEGKLKPPSVYINDEDYILHRMLHEI